MGRITYFINEKERTVTAFMDEIFDLSLSWAIDNICDRGSNRMFGRPVRHFEVTAKCNELDTWDVEEGKRIARKRLLAMYYGEYRAFVQRERQIMNAAFDQIEKKLERR